MQILNIHHLKFGCAILQIVFLGLSCVPMQISLSNMVSRESKERVRSQVDVAQFSKKYFHIWKVSVVLSYSTDKLNFSKWYPIDTTEKSALQSLYLESKKKVGGGAPELVLYLGTLLNNTCNYL